MSASWALSREWLGRNRGQARVDRFLMALAPRQQPTQHFERVEPELAEALPLDDDPVVVPLGEEIAGEDFDAGGLEVRRVTVLEQPSRFRDHRHDVDQDCGLHGQGLPVRGHEVSALRVDLPQSGSEIGSRTMLGRVRPERSRDSGAQLRPLPHGEECKHPLRIVVKRHDRRSPAELETAEEGEVRRLDRGIQTVRATCRTAHAGSLHSRRRANRAGTR